MQSPVLLAIIAVIPIFGLLVFVHELGHFIAAKWAGIRVEEFALGFPPTIVSVRKRDDGRWDVLWFGRGRDNGTGSAQNLLGTSGGVSRTDQGSVAPFHTLYSLNLLPIGGFVRMPGEDGDVHDESGNYDPESFSAKPANKRIVVLSAGVIMNFLLAIALFTLNYGIYGEPVNPPPAVIGGVQAASPAQAAGILPNDTVLSVNGHATKLFDDMRNIVNAAIANDKNQHTTVAVTMVVQHQGATQPVTLVVHARTHAGPNQGALGVLGKTVYATVPLWQAPFKGIQQTFSVTGQFLVSIWQMVTGKLPVQLAGPVGVAQLAGQAAQSVPESGWWPLVTLTSILSLNLAIVNILPFPALDGGRIVLVLVEVLRGGKRLKPEREGLINFIGLAVLLLLMLVVTVGDILQWGVRQ